MQAFYFDKLVEGMLRPEMILEAVDLIMTAVNQEVVMNVVINNRVGGNAPLLAQMIAKRFLQKTQPPPKGQLKFW